MSQRRRLLLILLGIVIALALVVFALLQLRVQRRHPLPRETAREAARQASEPGRIPPREEWSRVFRQLPAPELVELLASIEKREPQLYRDWNLGYLHARALIDAGEEDDAEPRLEPFLAKNHPFRAAALFHRASIAEGEEASRFRLLLIEQHRDSHYAEEVIEEEIAWLTEQKDRKALEQFGGAIAPRASTAQRRDVAARIAELEIASGAVPQGTARALGILRGGTTDDASDRASRALDRPEILARLNPAQLASLGQTLQTHRHFDRAIAVLRLALSRGWVDDLQFSLGRSHFGAEQYEQAEQTYLRGSTVTRDPEKRALFLWHAARAAQLRGDDARAEQLMTGAIAVKGTFPATRAAITQRIRTRLHRKQYAAAASDLAQLRRMAPNDRAVYEGSLAYAVGQLAAGNGAAAASALASVPSRLLDPYDRAEVDYWTGRALEKSNPEAAISRYRAVLMSRVESHYRRAARARLAAASLRPAVDRAVATRDKQVETLLAQKQFDLAKDVQQGRLALTVDARGPQLRKLESIYREIPEYRRVLELNLEPLPTLASGRKLAPDEQLMALGLFDDALPAIEKRWDLRPAANALTRSYAMYQANASRSSIYAIEVMMRAIPQDFEPELLPKLVRQLLHPRYYWATIQENAERYDADPNLVLSIMREESRFNPRAKSQAAARGLLQFIITTARDIGRDVGLVDIAPEDLYDPAVIIRLGARYIGELSEQFGGDRHRIAAAYNAGPNQTRLWSRLQAAPGDDYFIAAVNFDETKHYVRKVTASHDHYTAER